MSRPKRSRNVVEDYEDYSLHSGRQLILEQIVVSEEKALFNSKKDKIIALIFSIESCEIID